MAQFLEVAQQRILGAMCNAIYCFVANYKFNRLSSGEGILKIIKNGRKLASQ